MIVIHKATHVVAKNNGVSGGFGFRTARGQKGEGLHYFNRVKLLSGGNRMRIGDEYPWERNDTDWRIGMAKKVCTDESLARSVPHLQINAALLIRHPHALYTGARIG